MNMMLSASAAAFCTWEALVAEGVAYRLMMRPLMSKRDLFSSVGEHIKDNGQRFQDSVGQRTGKRSSPAREEVRLKKKSALVAFMMFGNLFEQ